MRPLLLTLIACTLVLPVQAQYSGGTGEPNDPYQIATAADLIALGETPADYDKHFILTADIDLDPSLPGGRVLDRAVIAPNTNDVEGDFQGTPFTGVFDGNEHTISNLTIAGGSYLGLFGLAGSPVRKGAAFVKNLELIDTRITGTGNYVGGLAGSNDGSVTECCSSGVVSGNMYVGGLVGYSRSWMYGPGRIMDCYSMAAVSATTGSAGGLVGFNSGAIIRCYSTGPVSAPVGAGGLVGEPWEDWGATVTDCFWDTETSGQATSTGGMGKTTLEMYAASTFVAWGACVSVWTIDDGRDYPRLVWENGPGRIIAGPTFAGGSGTIEDPFLIASAEDLDTLSLYSCHWDRHFKLVTDIDLSGRTWMGPVVLRFSGIFDGNGHTVSHLAITGGSSLGLFGQLSGEVKDLGVVDVNITGSGDYVAGLVGWNSGAVTRCHSTGAVSSNSHVGGLVGVNFGSITTSYCTGAVTGDSGVGGLIGGNYRGDVKRCYSTSAVVGSENVGGLIGNHAGGAIETCYAAGYVTGSGAVGGLVGLNESVLMDSYSLSIVSGNNRVGGLVGKNSNAVRRCYSAGAVNGDQYVGGLVGSNIFAAGTEIAESFWDVVSSESSRMCGLGSGDNSLGRDTAEMQTAATFLDAGWDFVGETDNGTDDIWWIDEGQDYPRLWWELSIDE